MSKDDLFPIAAPDFSDPLGLLRACHERVFKHCDLTEDLAAHIADQGIDQAAREAAAQVHRYFAVAAKHHHEDEEQELFPRLARQSTQLAELVHSLKQEHGQLDALWAEFEPLLATPAAIQDIEEFQSLAERFSDAYRTHARRENSELLDGAEHFFDSDELKQIGQSMAERRGVKQRF
jgi:hemerythrin-like domain-containing protein